MHIYAYMRACVNACTYMRVYMSASASIDNKTAPDASPGKAVAPDAARVATDAQYAIGASAHAPTCCATSAA
jgi:hypothetical protein